MQVPVSPTTLKEYGYQRRLEQFLMYVMDRLLGNPKSDGFLRAMFSNPYLVRTQQVRMVAFKTVKDHKASLSCF